MSETTQPVEVSVLIDARPSTVFFVLADPEQFMGFMGGAGGRFEGSAGTPFEIDFPQFQTRVAGDIVELVENERLTLTWGVAEGPQAETLPAGSTRVEITLEPEGASTRVTLRHSGLPSVQERTNHEAGWRFHMGRLALLANRTFLGAVLETTAPTFFAARNERDADTRMELLREVCVPEVAFADEYATLQGLEDLSLHIGNSQMYMPGCRVEQDGAASICLSEALIPWKMLDADGNVVHRGYDHAQVSPEGRFERVKGFWQ
jgi:uncharacterized protein YndB with AHSA1/START domain